MRSYLLEPLYSHPQFRGMRRFAAFDGIRAVAALLVVVFHFAGPGLSFLSGWLGVHLFFVLSGFLITTLLLREETATQRVSLSHFWIRRVFRILPAYWLVLALTLAIIALNGEVTSAGVRQSVVWFLAVSPDLAPTAMGFLPAWTIGIEQKFYLVWPLLGFVFLLRKPARRAVIWFLALAVILMLTFLVSSYFVHFAVILFGCGLALLMDSPVAFQVGRVLATRAAGVLALLALVALQIGSVAVIQWGHGQVPLILLYGLAAALALPGLCAETATARVLSIRPLRWLGDRSYSIYLIQVIGGGVVDAMFPALGWPRFFVVVAVVIVFADVIHRWVEVPGIRLGKKWIDHLDAGREAARGDQTPFGEVPASGA